MAALALSLAAFKLSGFLSNSIRRHETGIPQLPAPSGATSTPPFQSDPPTLGSQSAIDVKRPATFLGAAATLWLAVATSARAVLAIPGKSRPGII